MTYTFISYSHTDREYAHKLADALQEEMLSAWIDDRIDYGSQWPHVIQEQLDNCGALIVIMTPCSYQSVWVQNELSRAQRKRKPIFPLLLEGEPWLSVEATQFVDVRKGQLPARGFYNGIALHVPRRTEREVLIDYMPKVQFYIDAVGDSYTKIDFETLSNNIKKFDRTLNTVTTRVNKGVSKNELKVIWQQMDEAHTTFSKDLLQFADSTRALIPEMRLNWYNLRKYTFAFLSVRKFNKLVEKQGIVKFRSDLSSFLTKTSTLAQELSEKDYSSLKWLSTDRAGIVEKAADAAESAVHECAAELKIGTGYLEEIIKLLDETLETFNNDEIS